MADEVDPNAQVTVTSESGRTLTGLGVSTEALEATIDRHEPDETPAKSETPGGATPPATPQTQEPVHLAKGRARYQALQSERDLEKARADTAEKERDDLKARLSQPPRHETNQGSAAPQPPALPVQQQAPPATRPEPTEDDVGTKYETYAAFTKDQALWVWEQQQASIDQRIRQGIDGHQQQTAFAAHVESTRVKGRAIYKDFDQVMQQGAGIPHANMPAAALQRIWQHPQAEHLVHAILKDAPTAQRIAWLAVNDPYSFGLELAQLAPKPQGNGTGNGHQPPPPAPMQPVGSGGRTATPRSTEATNYETYKAARTAERRGR